MFVLYYLQKLLKLYILQTKMFLNSCFLRLMFKDFSLGCTVTGSSLIRKKGELSKMTTRCHSLSIVVTRSLLLSLVASRCTTCCISLYHSLSFVVTRCITCSFYMIKKSRQKCEYLENERAFKMKKSSTVHYF